MTVTWRDVNHCGSGRVSNHRGSGWVSNHRASDASPPTARAGSAVAGRVCWFSLAFDLFYVAPGVWAAAVRVGEVVDLRQLARGQGLAGPPCDVRVCCQGRRCSAYERWGLGDYEVWLFGRRVAPVFLAYAEGFQH